MESPPAYDSEIPNGLGIAASDDALQASNSQSELFAGFRHQNVRREFVDALSMELLLREECDWGALLSHAPRALSSLGLCFIVASSPLASSIEVPTTNELQYTSLRANLVHCSDLGRAAFSEAQTKMYRVGMNTQYICGKGGTIELILECLEDDALAKHDLLSHLEKLKAFANECIEDAGHVQKCFSAWQAKAEAIRRVCEEKNHRVTRDQNSLSAQSHNLSTQKEWITADIAKMKLESLERRKDVEFHRARYMEASKPFSSGWEGNVQRLVGTIVEGAGHVAEVGASIFAMNLSVLQHPLAQLAAPLLQTFVQKKKEAMRDEPQKTDADASDYGFHVAERMIAPLKHFLDSLGDDNTSSSFYGMDWAAISGHSRSNMPVSALINIIRPYEDDPELADSSTSTTLRAKGIIDQTSEVCAQIDGWVKSERDMKGRGLDGLSQDVVNQWRHSLQSALKDAKRLAKRAKQIDSDGRSSAEKRKNTYDKKNRLSRLAQCRENYNASRRVLEEAEARLRDRTQRERQALDEFNAIQSKLESLQEGQVTMTQIREVLGACMQNLSQLQRHLTQLTTFFAELHVFIETTYKTRGQEFARVADGMDRLTLEKAPEERPAFKRERMERLLLQSLELRAYYAVMREISTVYVDVSKKYIMPGIDQMDQLSLVDSSVSGLSQRQIKDKIRQIANYASEGHNEISALANKRKEGLLKQLSDRRGEAEQVGQMIADAEHRIEDGDDAGDALFAF